MESYSLQLAASVSAGSIHPRSWIGNGFSQRIAGGGLVLEGRDSGQAPRRRAQPSREFQLRFPFWTVQHCQINPADAVSNHWRPPVIGSEKIRRHARRKVREPRPPQRHLSIPFSRHKCLQSSVGQAVPPAILTSNFYLPTSSTSGFFTDPPHSTRLKLKNLRSLRFFRAYS